LHENRLGSQECHVSHGQSREGLPEGENNMQTDENPPTFVGGGAL
jgi:hypothetical protein